MKVDLSDRPLAEVERIDTSWRRRFSSPEVFLRDLQEAVELIETAEVLGPAYDAKAKRRVRRLLPEKSEFHLYLVRKSEDLVVVVSIWSARRRHGLKL